MSDKKIQKQVNKAIKLIQELSDGPKSKNTSVQDLLPHFKTLVSYKQYIDGSIERWNKIINSFIFFGKYGDVKGYKKMYFAIDQAKEIEDQIIDESNYFLISIEQEFLLLMNSQKSHYKSRFPNYPTQAFKRWSQVKNQQYWRQYQEKDIHIHAIMLRTGFSSASIRYLPTALPWEGDKNSEWTKSTVTNLAFREQNSIVLGCDRCKGFISKCENKKAQFKAIGQAIKNFKERKMFRKEIFQEIMDFLGNGKQQTIDLGIYNGDNQSNQKQETKENKRKNQQNQEEDKKAGDKVTKKRKRN